MILFDRVSKRYSQSAPWSLNNLSLVIEPGEFVLLVGPSGAGKSTILKLLIREIRPTTGTIVVGGIDYSRIKQRDIPRLRRQIGMVFQDFKLLPNRTAAENVAFALQITGSSRLEIQKVVPRVLRIVNMVNKAKSLPSELSGGEKQRVAIARSLVRQPKLLIADEPTGNLDPKHAWDVIEMLLKINELGTTVILATHNVEVVKRLHHRVIALEAGKLIEAPIATRSRSGRARKG